MGTEKLALEKSMCHGVAVRRDGVILPGFRSVPHLLYDLGTVSCPLEASVFSFVK